MTVQSLIKILRTIKDKQTKIYVASDEEWNTVNTKINIEPYYDKKDAIVIYGYTGTSIEI